MTKIPKSTPVLTDSIDICHALVGLKDIFIIGYCRKGPVGQMIIEQKVSQVICPRCGKPAVVKDRATVTYTDLACYGTPMKLKWKKHRIACNNRSCPVETFTLGDHPIAAKGCRLTTRAAKWATKQIGEGRTIRDVAKELGCSWGVVSRAVNIYGTALIEADRKRLKDTKAVGLDETLFVKRGKFKEKHWSTSVVDVQNSQLIDIVPTRNFVEVAGFFDKTPEHFKANVSYAALDMSQTYSAVFSQMLPNATQVVDRFHLIRLANAVVDQVRRRVQYQQLGHRGRRGDPLFGIRKLLVMRSDHLDEKMTEKIQSLLSFGDPDGEIALAYALKEAVHTFYESSDFSSAKELLGEITAHCAKKSMPEEIRRLGRTIKKWFDKILAYHWARITNAPTEGLNNLIKRVKRTAYGFSNFENFRVRALLYAGKPNWRVLDSIVVR